MFKMLEYETILSRVIIYIEGPSRFRRASLKRAIRRWDVKFDTSCRDSVMIFAYYRTRSYWHT